MADFYIVPPRLIVGSFDRTNAVTSINTLKGDLTLVSDTNTGLRISVSGGNFRFSVDPGFYVAKSGDNIVGNITFNPSGSNFGLAVGSGLANPGTGVTGALFYNTTDSALKVYNGNTWGDILSAGGITQVQGDLRYLKLDGTNTPTGNISMGSQFLRLANLASQVSAGLAGQVFFNQDTYEINVYTGSAWRNVGIAISSIAGVGISVDYSSFGSTVSINENYPFTWTGAQTYTQAITFAAAQTFDINKLNITGQSSGDIIYFNGSNWARLPVGSPNQGLKVLPSGTGITWGVVSSSGGAGVSNLNNLTDGYQYFATGTSGTLFNISSVGQTHTFNIPIAGVGVTGLVSSQAQTFKGSKTFSSDLLVSSSTVTSGSGNGALVVYGGVGISGTLFVGGNISLAGLVTSGTWAGSTITVNYGGTGYASYTKGDLLAGSGSSFLKFGVGADGYVLSSNSNTPSGLGWTSVNSVGVSTTPPSGPENADLWFNTIDGSLNVYYQDIDTSQWVEIAVGSGIDLSQPVHITSGNASTNTSTGALIVDGGVGVGGQLNASSIGINGGYDLLYSSLVTSTTSANQVGFAVSSANYRTLKFVVSVNSGSDYQSDEILLMHNGSTVFMTEYAQLLSGSGTTITTYDGEISTGNLRLLVSPLNSVTTYSISCTGL